MYVCMYVITHTDRISTNKSSPLLSPGHLRLKHTAYTVTPGEVQMYRFVQHSGAMRPGAGIVYYYCYCYDYDYYYLLLLLFIVIY